MESSSNNASTSRIRPTDADILRDGRKGALKDSEELAVEVSLRDQSLKKLVSTLEEQDEGSRTVELWRQGNMERTDWIERQQELLQHYDEFIEPIYNATQSWSSTLHLPVMLTMVKTYHARMLAAMLSIDPPFTVKARQAANVERAMLIQELMRYTISAWVNKHKGIEEVADAWIWSWITAGRGWLKNRWERSFTRYMDVVEESTNAGSTFLPGPDGGLQEFPNIVKKEVEKERVIKTFDGPMMEFLPNEDVIMIGGSDPQEADHVLHSTYMTASELWSLVDQKVFREDAVKKAIEFGESQRSADPTGFIKDQQRVSSGEGPVDTTIDEQRYQVIERHSRIVIDQSGIASDVIMWVHGGTGAILRATYLYRVMKTGLRPFFCIDFHRRQNGAPAGLPELLYTLAKEIDAIHNMKMDFGLVSSMPFGFYKSTSSLSDERMPLEPGVLIPLDNPQTDVFFPNLGARTGFLSQDEALIYNQIERFTAISDISLGIVGGQGAARTATGARALLGESNANLDVYLRRMNRGFKRALVHLFHMVQDRIEPGFQFRILGDDGSMYWETIKSREELAGMYDFELEASSANSNKQIQIEQANSVLQTVANPFFIQLGIVSPANIFNALKLKFQVEGLRDYSKYISKPQGPLQVHTPEEIANATLAGIDIKLGPQDDLEGFIAFFDNLVKHDELLGQFNEQQTVLLARKAQEAASMLESMQAQQAQVANQQQMAMNAGMANGQQPPQMVPQGAAGPAQAPDQQTA